jgi:tRNA1Val (adenine37-N6)-methyltransferase
MPSENIDTDRRERSGGSAGELEIPIGADETLDRLTSKFRVLQKRRGHRVSSDDTLLAWAAARARPDAVRILDLGSGKGTVAILLLQRLPLSRVTGLEALEINHDLARRNAFLNQLSDRWEPRLGDLRDPSALAGEPLFDLVTGAPPFIPVGKGVLPKDPQRAAGRIELRGGVRDYAETAARVLAPGGRVVLLMDGLEQSLSRTIKALAAAGLHSRTITAVHPFPGRDPVYRIFDSGADSGPTATAALCMRLHGAGGFTPEYEAIRLDMDCAQVRDRARLLE